MNLKFIETPFFSFNSKLQPLMKCISSRLVIGCYLISCFNVSAEVVSGTVVAVHDGDTITLKTNSEEKKIRLASIDAPELNQAYGAKARDTLKGLVLGKQVQVDFSKRDKYSRLVGQFVKSGARIPIAAPANGALPKFDDPVSEVLNF